jgi:hypothetical protein
MARKETWESTSLAWIHRVREDHYRKTRNLPVETWLKPVDPQKAVGACRQLGLNVRLAEPRKRRTLQPERNE